MLWFFFLVVSCLFLLFINKTLHEDALLAQKGMWKNRKGLGHYNVWLTLCPTSLFGLHILVDDGPMENTVLALRNPCVKPWPPCLL